MAKGERNKKNWRLVLLWKMTFMDRDPVYQSHGIQVPPEATPFWLNLKYRCDRLREEFPDAVMIECMNPAGPSKWLNPKLHYNEFGFAKIAMNRLVYGVKPTCPHCGKPIPMEEFGK